MSLELYQDYINGAANKYGLDPRILSAQIMKESEGNPLAVGKAGEIGLMQMKPATADELGTYNLFDPAQNIDAGAKYLSQQLKGGSNYYDALRAYNAGPTGAAKNANSGADYAAEILKNALGDETIVSTEAQAGVAVNNTVDSVGGWIGDIKKTIDDYINSFLEWLKNSTLALGVGAVALIALLFGIYKLSTGTKLA